VCRRAQLLSSFEVELNFIVGMFGSIRIVTVAMKNFICGPRATFCAAKYSLTVFVTKSRVGFSCCGRTAKKQTG
jgi:hypothetical protein